MCKLFYNKILRSPQTNAIISPLFRVNQPTPGSATAADAWGFFFRLSGSAGGPQRPAPDRRAGRRQCAWAMPTTPATFGCPPVHQHPGTTSHNCRSFWFFKPRAAQRPLAFEARAKSGGISTGYCSAISGD